jgi:hypothetical protein
VNVYVYQAALLCEPCGRATCARLTAEGSAPENPQDEASFDSDEFPKGPTDEGESDSPSHCAECGAFLESELTEEGDAYVRDAVTQAQRRDLDAAPGQPGPDAVALTEWAPYYIDGYHDCDCCGVTVVDRFLCDGCAKAGCEANGAGIFDDCQVPQCLDCCEGDGPRASFMSDGKWHSNCDEPCPNVGKSWEA